jgi:hypothetical protein
MSVPRGLSRLLAIAISLTGMITCQVAARGPVGDITVDLATILDIPHAVDDTV